MSAAEHILFVTGRLAEKSLRDLVGKLQQEQDFSGEVCVLGISVAALMHVDWVARKLEVPSGVTRVILPGWCQGELKKLEEKYGVPFERGPKDLRDLPNYLSGQAKTPPDLSRYDIEILAEINHAPRLTDQELLAQAKHFRDQGADLIDYGCIAGEVAPNVAHQIRLLTAEGFRVSIDSFDQAEVEPAVDAGAELILSCNATNVDWITRLGTEVVVIPDDFQNLQTMEPTIEKLQAAGVPLRLDPILEPIGIGFFASLQRYAKTRELWPEVPLMMGIGNVTELTEVDSAGVNMILIAICQELGIHSVLTTAVINWARDSVYEIDIARRMVKYALDEQRLPKHIDSRLAMLRDPYVLSSAPDDLTDLARKIKDPNYRIFAAADGLHLMNRDGHWVDEDPFVLLREALAAGEIDPAHAFYLGYELAHAETARQLSKQYIQDQPLQWGGIDPPPGAAVSHRSLRRPEKSE